MNDKISQRLRRKQRVRARFSGTKQRPRVSIFRSNSHIYVQVIDDDTRSTLLGAGDEMKPTKGQNKVSRSFELGKTIATHLKEKKINAVVFDRSGYRYHGRVKAVADGLREGGLKV